MRLLFLGLNFPPDLVGIAKYSGELMEWLSHRHSVSVITALPHYPAWRIDPEESRRRWRLDERFTYPVRRVPLYVPAKPSGKKRLIHSASFAAAAVPIAIHQVLTFRPDIIATVAPTLAGAPVVSTLARLAGARSWLHVQDFEVDVAFDFSMIRRPQMKTAATMIERMILKGFDLVSSISPPMVSKLIAKGVDADRTAMFPNWVDTAAIRSGLPSRLRREWGIADDAILVLYSGTMGSKQGLPDVVEAARLLQNDPRIAFVFSGEGPIRSKLEAQAAGLSHVSFFDFQPTDRLPDLLAAADIHVLPQRAAAEDLVMPSKLGPILASGKPVIATAEPHSHIAEMIKNAGYLVPPENPLALADAVRRLAAAPDERQELGSQGRLTAERELAQDAIFKRIERCLLQLKEGISA